MNGKNVVRVDPGVLAEFKKAVLEKHEKLRGVLLEEASEAIRRYTEELKEGGL